jgi:ribonuclease HI
LKDYNIRITDSSSIDSQNNTGGGRVTSAAELMFEGGARPPNNGVAAIGFTLQIVGKPRGEFGEPKERATCNEAEYHALICGLRIALDLGVDELTAKGDSELVVCQMRSEFKTREPRLRKLRDEANMLVKQFDEFEIKHIPRIENEVADSLVDISFESVE